MQAKDNNDAVQGLQALRSQIDALLANKIIEDNEGTQDFAAVIDGMIDIVSTTEGPEDDAAMVPMTFMDCADKLLGFIELVMGTSPITSAPYSHRYIIDAQGEAVPANDYAAASRPRRVARTVVEFRGIKVGVSTVFLVWNRASHWETRTSSRYCPEFDELQERYSSRREAVNGHRAFVTIAGLYLRRKRTRISSRRVRVAARRMAAGQDVLRRRAMTR